VYIMNAKSWGYNCLKNRFQDFHFVSLQETVLLTHKKLLYTIAAFVALDSLFSLLFRG